MLQQKELLAEEGRDDGGHVCECGAEFDSQDQLDAHVREEHEAGPVGGFICKACGMEFGSQEELDAHAKAEHGLDPIGGYDSRTDHETYPPIASYALIGDSHSSGLVSRDGGVDWACFRRFDAPSTFARILDWDRGGFCSLAPVGAEPAGRAYAPDTAILESEHRAGDARGRTTDFFAVSDAPRAGEGGRAHPYHQLIRIAEGVAGTTEWEFVCQPCFEYGIVRPHATLSGERTALLVGDRKASPSHPPCRFAPRTERFGPRSGCAAGSERGSR